MASRQSRFQELRRQETRFIQWTVGTAIRGPPTKAPCQPLGNEAEPEDRSTASGCGTLPSPLSPPLLPPSMCGHRVPPESVIHFYCATKYAVTALTEGLRQELLEAQTHIRATVRLWTSPGGNGVGRALPPAHVQEGLLRGPGFNECTSPGRCCSLGGQSPRSTHPRANGQTHTWSGRGQREGTVE